MGQSADTIDRTDNDQGVKVLLSSLRRDLPGPSMDNRWEQSNHFKGVLYIAICAIANALAGSSVKVMKRSGVRKSLTTQFQRDDELVEVDSDNRVVKLFEEVNPQDTFADLLTDWVIQGHLTGSTRLWARPNVFDQPCELYVLPTALLYPLPVTNEYPLGAWRVQSYYGNNNVSLLPGAITSGVILPGEEIKTHRITRHPLYRWDGFSPLTAGGVQLDVLEAIDQSRKAAMDHGFNPDAVITVAGANEQTLRRLQADFESKHGGSYNARKVFITSGQGVSVEHLNAEPKQMDYGPGWDQMLKFALALFGVPPGVAGVAEATSYAQLYASLKQFHVLKLQPLARSIASFLTRHVARKIDPDVTVTIDVPAIDDQSVKDVQLEADANQNAITLNEYRGRRSLPLMPDGDRMIKDPSAEQMAQMQGGQQPPQDDDMPPDGTKPEDVVTSSVMGMLGAGDDDDQGGDVQKSFGGGPFDQQKHPRNHGKFAPKGSGNVSGAMRAGQAVRGAADKATNTVDGWAKRVFQPVTSMIAAFHKLDDKLTDFGGWAAKIDWPGTAVNTVRRAIDKLTGAGEAEDALATVAAKNAGHDLMRNTKWAQDAARKHADRVARKLNKDPRQVERALYHLFVGLAHKATKRTTPTSVRVKDVGRFTVRQNKQTASKAPSNGAGSLPPRLNKKARRAMASILKSL